MKKQKFTHRMLALAMTLCMIFGMMPMSAHATEVDHTHEWHSSWSTDENAHWHICVAGDGCTAQSEYAAHNWDSFYPMSCLTCWYYQPHDHQGGDAVCHTRATCELCGFLYGELNPDKHTKNNYISIDATSHKVTCKCDTTVVESEEHKYYDWEDNGDGTQSRMCYACGYTETQNIEHTHSYGEWTSNNNGTHSKTCTSNDDTQTADCSDSDDANELCDTCGYDLHEHSYSNEKDGTYHWEECSCGDVQNKTEHTWNPKTDDEYHWEECSCGKVRNNYLHDMVWSYDEHTHQKACACGLHEVESQSHTFDSNTDTLCDTCGYLREVFVITGDLPVATVGEAYSASFSYSGEASGVIFWSATGLPDGLSMDAGTGVVSGTPTTAGTYDVTIAMGATGGGSASRAFTLTVENTPAHTHSYRSVYNETHHWEECGCDRTRNKEEHFDDDGDKLCDTCGYDLHKHTYDVIKYNNTYHWTECICGDFEIRDFHKFDDDYDATCDCGYTRDLTHEHEWPNEWAQGNNDHSRKCTGCSSVDKQPHYYGDDVSSDDDAYGRVCDVCGYINWHRHTFEGGNCVTPSSCTCGAKGDNNMSVHAGFTGGDCATESTCACGAKGEKNKSVHAGGTKLVDVIKAVGLTDGYTGDTRCSSCNALLEKGEVIPAPHQIVKPVDGDGMYDGKIEVAIPVDSFTDDTKVVVGEYTVVDDDMDEFGASTGLTPVPELEYDKLEILTNEDYNNNHITTYQGKDYPPGSIVTINGREYLVTGPDSLVDMSDGLFWNLVGNELTRETVSFDGKVEKLEDTYVTINGVVYDAVYQYYGVTYLYIDGEPAGFYSNPSGEQLNVKFYPSKDPESVKKASKYPAFSFNPPADTTIGGVDFEAGKVYNATTIAATDISVTGALINPDAAEEAARAKVEELRKKRDEAKGAYLHAVSRGKSNEEIEAARKEWNDARLALNEAIMELEKYQVKQEVPVPEEYVGNENVSYIAVHYGELGAEVGEIEVSEDGKTLNVTYAVSDFSPFVIYAITEREEVEIQKTVLTGITIDENPTDEPTTSPQTSDNWIWYVLVAVAAGAVIVVTMIYGKRRKSKVN